MQLQISCVADLGLAMRAVRQSSRIRLDDLAGTVKLSKQFVQDAEYGKPTVQMGLVFKLLEELGLTLEVSIPESSVGKLLELQAKGLRRP
jgi:transcriptional regulator with XRE-family HTH domain